MAGKFLVFEGGHASGKTTLAKRLSFSLTERGKKVVTTKEPFNNDIRKFLVGRPGQDLIIDCFDNSEARAILQRNYLDFVRFFNGRIFYNNLLSFCNNYSYRIYFQFF